MDLLSYIKEKIPVSAIQSISTFLGENPHDTAIVLDGLLPYALGEIASKATTKSDFSQIDRTIDDLGEDSTIAQLDSLSADSTRLLKIILTGTKQANSVIGNENWTTVVEKMSVQTGIKKTSIASLLGFAMPLVLQEWKKQTKRSDTESDYVAFVLEQNEHVKKQLPSYLRKAEPIQLEEFSVPNTTDADIEEVNSYMPEPPIATEGVLPVAATKSFSFLPWLFVGLLGLGALYLLKNYQPSLNYLNKYLFSSDTKVDSLKVSGDSMVAVTSSPLAQDLRPSKQTKKKSSKVETVATDSDTKQLQNEPSRSTITETVTATGEVRNRLQVGKDWVPFSAKDGQAIGQIAAFLQANPSARVKVSGEFYEEAFDSDCSIRSRKSASFNNACRVKRNLEKQGIASNRIQVGTVHQSFKRGNVGVKVL